MSRQPPIVPPATPAYPGRRERVVAWLLATFLISGQFFACYWNTDRLWPFNPILVYTSPGDFKASSGAVIVAFRGDEEKDVVELGWLDEYLARKFATCIALSEPGDADRNLEMVKSYLEPSKHGFEGVRVYRLTYNLRHRTLVKRKLLAEARCKN